MKEAEPFRVKNRLWEVEKRRILSGKHPISFYLVFGTVKLVKRMSAYLKIVLSRLKNRLA